MNGERKLNSKEAAQRAKAMKCVRSKSSECQGQVYVGLFFDGTGNNDKWVEDGHTQTQRVRNKHSNVARLFDAHINEPENGMFSYYMPGVGTPFAEVGDVAKWEYGNGGMGFGFMGADRINWGITSVFNAIHRYLLGRNLLAPDEQRSLVNTISRDVFGPLSVEGAMRWTGLTAVEEQLASVVKSHQRKVLQINVSIFGFSRGAAQARACAYWLSQICERDGGGMTLAGVPLRIGFMGLFDTVASVGMGDVTPFTDGHMAWAKDTQAVHPAVEDCAHFIALHEQRAFFPLEAAVGRGNVGYPGMHSDVGGGYWPGEQGKAMPEWGDSPHLSQIPLIDMHFAAIKGGVPMMTIQEIKADPGVAKSFATDERLLKAYNTWLTHNGVKGADICTFTEGHARHYIRWRASLHLSRTAEEARAAGQEQKVLDGEIARLKSEQQLLERQRLNEQLALSRSSVGLNPATLLPTAEGLRLADGINARYDRHIRAIQNEVDELEMRELVLGGGVAGCAFFKRATRALDPKKDQTDLAEADRFFRLQLLWLLERRHANASMSGYVKERLKTTFRLISPLLGTLLIEPGKSPLTDHEKKFVEIAVDATLLPLGCAELFADYVHDSRAGFRVATRQEPIVLTGGYLRFRHVFKEEIHGESRVYGWANEGLSAAKHTANAVVQFYSDLWDATVAAYARARRQIAAAGVAAIQAASTAYLNAQDAVARRYHDAEDELYRRLTERYAEMEGAINSIYLSDPMRR
ncbi:MAG: DUF2235 domain-containing protein [Rhizobacter sp.]